MISLQKNKAISLTKEANGATKFEVRIKWDINSMTGKGADADVSAILCDANKKCLAPDSDNFIFYGNLSSKDGSVVHTGDERTGASEGWDEIIKIDFSKMEEKINLIPIIVSLYDDGQAHSFGEVSNLEVQIHDMENDKVVASYLPELENDSDTVLVVGEFTNKAGKAFFKATGEGSNLGMPKALSAYGVNAN